MIFHFSLGPAWRAGGKCTDLGNNPKGKYTRYRYYYQYRAASVADPASLGGLRGAAAPSCCELDTLSQRWQRVGRQIFEMSPA